MVPVETGDDAIGPVVTTSDDDAVDADERVCRCCCCCSVVGGCDGCDWIATGGDINDFNGSTPAFMSINSGYCVVKLFFPLSFLLLVLL